MSSTVHRYMPQSRSWCGTGCGTGNGTAYGTGSADGPAGPAYLVVSETGRKKLVLRYQVDGVLKDEGLGAYPAVGLRDARDRAMAARKLVAHGVDPIEAERAAKKATKPIPTFGEIAKLVIEDAQSKSVNAKVRYQWERLLTQNLSGSPMQVLATAPEEALISRILDQRVLEAVVGLRERALDKQEVSFGKPIQRRLQRALVEASHGSEQRIRETAAQHCADLRGLARSAEPIEPCRERLLQGRRDRLRTTLFAALTAGA
jgi:hypothetical protein